MGRSFTATLALALLASGARAQVVESWPPAFTDVHSALAAGTAHMHVMVGVPGEVMHVRLVAKGPASTEGWVIDLLQPDAATQSFAAGPAGAITVPPVVFGDSGAVALRLSSLDGSGGDYVLRARGHLPPGFKHPEISLAVSDGYGAAWFTDSPLRPGLQLRARVRLPHDATGWPAGVVPHFFHDPAPLVGQPYDGVGGVEGTIPGKPYPDLVTFIGYPQGFEHVFFSVEDDDVILVGARVRRKKVVLGGKPQGPPSAQPAQPPPVFQSVDLDQQELAPGGSAHLLARVVTSQLSGCPAPTITARVWLSSVHRINPWTFGGTLLAGPLEVPFVGDEATIESDITVPEGTPPGLWGVWVVLGTQGAGWGCDNLLEAESAETVLKVLAP